MTIRFLFATSLAVALIGVGTTASLAALRQFVATPISDAVYEVRAGGSAGSQIFWCGAADYARRVLGAGWRVEIYVARGRGKGATSDQGVAMQFTLDPAAAGIKPIPDGQGFDTMAVGYSMSVQRANSFCSMPPDR